MLTCALTGSHALLVGVPGLAKTLMVKALAATFDWRFARIQFTPDLMPSDITGYELLDRSAEAGANSMIFRRGPVFANLVLADEINRAAPKTQSALLEAMAERHVTVGGQTYPLEEPFLVVATQNPIEQEGTYPLPEAQLDRFMMEIRLDYPTREQEEDIVTRTTERPSAASVDGIHARARSCNCGTWCKRFRCRAASLRRRSICAAPAGPKIRLAGSFVKNYVAWGAGPRGSQNLVLAAKARALLLGRAAPSVDDVQALALPILRHRVIVNHRAVGDGVTAEGVVAKLIAEAAK